MLDSLVKIYNIILLRFVRFNNSIRNIFNR